LSVQDIQIVAVSLHEILLLQELSKKTFHDSFADVNTPGDMRQFLDHHFSLQKLESEIQNPDSSFYFAKTGSRILGYLKLNRGHAQSVLPNDNGLEIERIYVDQSFKGMGIGQHFILKAIDTAITFGLYYLWLGVWEHNAAAIRFYEKNGFQKYSQHIFKVGGDPQTDWLMKKTI
jgi:ribosomal protein S18 acetylase RimI-like enzyme